MRGPARRRPSHLRGRRPGGTQPSCQVCGVGATSRSRPGRSAARSMCAPSCVRRKSADTRRRRSVGCPSPGRYSHALQSSAPFKPNPCPDPAPLAVRALQRLGDERQTCMTQSQTLLVPSAPPAVAYQPGAYWVIASQETWRHKRLQASQLWRSNRAPVVREDAQRARLRLAGCQACAAQRPSQQGEHEMSRSCRRSE